MKSRSVFLVVLFRIKQDTYVKNNFIRETALSVHMTRENECDDE